MGKKGVVDESAANGKINYRLAERCRQVVSPVGAIGEAAVPVGGLSRSESTAIASI